MILFKTSVRIKRLSSELKFILDKLYDLNLLKIPNYPEDWVVTSINDSKHSENSKHYTDQALDLRSHNFASTKLKKEFVDRVAFSLGPKFTVLFENVDQPNEHFHIQLRKGLKSI